MRKSILLTAMLLLMLLSALMAQPTIKITKSEIPAWLKPISQKPQQINLDEISLGYYFELIENQYHLGNQTHYANSIKVLSDDSGAENAGQVSIDFDPLFQRVVIHRLQVERDGKIQDRLDLSKFKTVAVETDLSRLIYNGQYSSFTVLDDLRKGDKIIFSYSIIGFNPVFEGKFSNLYYLEGSEPNGLVHLVYVVPNGRKLNIKAHNGAKTNKHLVKDGMDYLYWEEPTQGSSTSDEYYIPYWYDKTAYIQASEFSSWRQVADWAKRVNPISEVKAGSALDNQIQQFWAESKQDTTAYFEKCLNFVQNSIRYMGIEMGENSHRAHAPEKVFNQRYGDCKDKSLLLASMLARKGIKSSLILANTYQDKELDKSLPSPYSFNHMVIAAVIEGKLKAVDPTISNQGSDVMDRYFPYYGKVLFLENGSKLSEVTKPVSTKGYFVTVEDVFQLLPEGKANLKVTTTYFDQEADRMRTYFKETAKNQIQNEYEDYYKQLYKKAKHLTPISFTDDLKNNIFIIKEEYVLDQYVVDEERRGAPAYMKFIYDRIPAVEEDRISPISVEYPLNINYIVKIINRDKQNIGSLEQNEDVIERDSYWYSRNLKTSKDTLIISTTFRFNDSFIPAEQVQDYITDYKKISAALNFYPYLNDEDQIELQNFNINEMELSPFAVLAFIVFAGLFSWILFKHYIKSRPSNLISVEPARPYSDISGILWILGIGLSLGNLMIFGVFFTSESPLNAKQWQIIDGFSNDKAHSILYFMYLSWWLLISVFSCVSTLFLTILFWKCRDIFPQTYVIIQGISIITILFTNFFLYLLNSSEFSISTNLAARDLWTIFIGILWCIYLYKSDRVKRTFVVPYHYEAIAEEEEEEEENLIEEDDGRNENKDDSLDKPEGFKPISDGNGN